MHGVVVGGGGGGGCGEGGVGSGMEKRVSAGPGAPCPEADLVSMTRRLTAGMFYKDKFCSCCPIHPRPLGSSI